jgi:hypothetical protein
VWLRRELVVDRRLVTPNSGVPALGPCKTARVRPYGAGGGLKSYAGWWPNEDEQIRAAVARAWNVPAASSRPGDALSG